MYLRILGFVGAETRTVENAEGARPSGYGCFRNHRAFFLFYCTGVCRLCVVTTWQAALFRVRVYGTAAATRPTNELQERRRRCHTLCDNLVMNHAELVFFLSFRAPIRASEDNDDDYGIFKGWAAASIPVGRVCGHRGEHAKFYLTSVHALRLNSRALGYFFFADETRMCCASQEQKNAI